MNAQVLELVLLILRALLPSIAELISAFARRLAATNPPNDLGERVLNIVRGIEYTHPDGTGEMKRELAANAVSLHCTKAGLSLSPSQINTLIELAVQSLPVSNDE